MRTKSSSTELKILAVLPGLLVGNSVAAQPLTDLPSYESCTQIIDSSPQLKSALVKIRSSDFKVISDVESSLIHSRFKEDFDLHFATLLGSDSYELTTESGSVSDSIELRLRDIEHPTFGLSTEVWVDLEVQIASNGKQVVNQQLSSKGIASYADSFFGPQRLNLAVDRAICGALSMVVFPLR